MNKNKNTIGKRSLQDGRKFWTEKNGFVFMMEDKKGQVSEVNEDYYRTMLNLFWKEQKARKRAA